ncbi:MAG: hypothetical protein JO250_18245 [Armatimonadetes bacterium]|nr:hypothetical protein [Armatimonadota bacterium]
MNECPHCHHKLLSQASPRCNWCGREIPDASYQQQAETKREAFFAEQALHDAASLARMEALNINPLLSPLDPFTGLPLGSAFPPRPVPTFGRAPQVEQLAPPPEPPAETAPEGASGGRFRHLEL